MSEVEDKSHTTQEIMPLAIPRLPIDELSKLTAYANEVKKTLMVKGEDYIVDGNRQYTTRSGFAKLHQGFTLSDEAPIFTTIYYDEPKEFTFKHRIRRDLKTETISTKIYGFECIVKVINIDCGRFAHGEGACTLEELHQTNNMSPKWYHRLKATAKTRAWNRAISNYVGSAEISAEEIGLTYPGDEQGSQESQSNRKKVEASQTDVYPLPKIPLDTPSWEFDEAVEAQGWEAVDGIIVAYLFDMGFTNPESAFEYGHDVAKAWIRNAPGVYFGDGMKEIDTVLQIAGFKYHGTEKRWRYPKLEKVSEEKALVVDEEKPAEVPEPREEEPPQEIPVVEEPDPAEEEEPPKGPLGSLEDIESRLREHIVDFDEAFKLAEREDSYRVYKTQHMKDDEIKILSDWIVQLGGNPYNKEENCWIIPKETN